MNAEREYNIKKAIEFCIEYFDAETAANRITEFIKDELKIKEQSAKNFESLLVNIKQSDQ